MSFFTKVASRRAVISSVICALSAVAAPALADVAPMLSTEWGQSGVWQQKTPRKAGEQTYPGCTTLAAAQILYYYQFQNHATSDVSYGLEHDPLTGADVSHGGSVLGIDFASENISYDWSKMATTDSESASRISAAAEFIYHVGVTLNAQFGGGQGSSATGRQIENAFRQQWGYTSERRRDMTIISKEAFGYSNQEWADVIYAELDAGRPVLYMAQQKEANAGHAYVIDGYRADGKVHVNMGWGGYANGYYDVNQMKDPSGRHWNRQAMIYKGLEPRPGFAASHASNGGNQGGNQTSNEVSWCGNGSLISFSSGTASGYGLTHDEAALHAVSGADSAVFFQWEVDGRDGRKLKIDAPGMTRATIRYGEWNDRSADRVYRNVSLPFVLDPSADDKPTSDQTWYSIAVSFDEGPAQSLSVTAEATKDSASASANASMAAEELFVDGHSFNGVASLISYSTGTKTGYGMTQDETVIHASSSKAPVVFFQWELDGRDGKKVAIAAESAHGATLRYGLWNSRSSDIVRHVNLPFVLDPAKDGLSTADGEYYTISLAFDEVPSQTETVTATLQ